MHDLGDLLVSATKGKATGSKKPRKPLKSALTPEHPSRLLTDGKHEMVYQEREFSQSSRIQKCTHAPMDDRQRNSSETATFGGVTYNVSARKLTQVIYQALIDRGANRCLFCSDCTLIGEPIDPRFVAITGLDNHQMPNVPIRNVGPLCVSNRGPVICIRNEVAYTGSEAKYQHQNKFEWRFQTLKRV